MSLNGLAASPIWPILLTIMKNWYGKSGRGLLMGIWASNANFGNFAGLQICHYLIIHYK